jgi:hypothetical protein
VHLTFPVLSLNPAPLRPKWEKGFGDEGKFAKLGMYSMGILSVGLNGLDLFIPSFVIPFGFNDSCGNLHFPIAPGGYYFYLVGW